MSESTWAHNPGRRDCETECGSVTKGGEQPRMKRLIGLDEVQLAINVVALHFARGRTLSRGMVTTTHFSV
eukprot:2132058-Pleurochrysis_carterae.AAC.1